MIRSFMPGWYEARCAGSVSYHRSHLECVLWILYIESEITLHQKRATSSEEGNDRQHP